MNKIKQQIYIGIDGGMNGGISVIKNDKIIDLIVMPTILSTKNKKEYDIQGIIKFLGKYSNATVVLEKAHAMPLLGSVQAFNFGRGYGILLGILSTLKMPYSIVHSRTWQKKMFRDTNHKDTKQASVIIAQRLFPDEDFRATERSKKMHDGLTDACLVAYYGCKENL